MIITGIYQGERRKAWEILPWGEVCSPPPVREESTKEDVDKVDVLNSYLTFVKALWVATTSLIWSWKKSSLQSVSISCSGQSSSNLCHSEGDINGIVVRQTWAVGPSSIHARVPVQIRGNGQREWAGCPSPSRQCEPDVVDPAALLGVLSPGVGRVTPWVVLRLIAVWGWESGIREIAFEAVCHQSPVLPWKLVDWRVRIRIEIAAEDLDVAGMLLQRVHLLQRLWWQLGSARRWQQECILWRTYLCCWWRWRWLW